MRFRTHLLILLFAFMVAGVCAVVGCNQNTDAPAKQVSDQGLDTSVSADRDAATQGSQVNVWVVNAPGRGGLPDPTPIDLSADDGVSELIRKVTTADGASIDGTDAGYAQAGINISINTGGTTPNLAGSTAGTGSAAQTPGQNPTVYPTQDVKPETTVSTPVAITPGGVADQQATATGRGQTSDTSKESDTDLRWAKLDAATDKLDAVLALLESMGITQKTPTSQPGADDGAGG